MNLRNDLIYPTCETFSTLFQGHHDSLVKQALQCDLIKDLLALLDAPLRDHPSPSATKALIVKALKAMTHSLLHGEEVSSVLKANPALGRSGKKRSCFCCSYCCHIGLALSTELTSSPWSRECVMAFKALTIKAFVAEGLVWSRIGESNRVSRSLMRSH